MEKMNQETLIESGSEFLRTIGCGQLSDDVMEIFRDPKNIGVTAAYGVAMFLLNHAKDDGIDALVMLMSLMEECRKIVKDQRTTIENLGHALSR